MVSASRCCVHGLELVNVRFDRQARALVLPECAAIVGARGAASSRALPTSARARRGRPARTTSVPTPRRPSRGARRRAAAITGSPQAIASTTLKPNGSRRSGGHQNRCSVHQLVHIASQPEELDRSLRLPAHARGRRALRARSPSPATISFQPSRRQRRSSPMPASRRLCASRARVAAPRAPSSSRLPDASLSGTALRMVTAGSPMASATKSLIAICSVMRSPDDGSHHAAERARSAAARRSDGSPRSETGSRRATPRRRSLPRSCARERSWNDRASRGWRSC